MPISQMPQKGLLNLQKLLPSQVQKIFERANQVSLQREMAKYHGRTATMMFFEPSTRTRLSFEIACHRQGVGPVLFDVNQGTSLEKGESKEDSILNAAAMKPDFLILRCGDELDLEKISREVRVPVLNAGWGIKGHPTQALLDIYTISQNQELKKTKLLIVGDVKHSRVAASHFELASILGIEVGVCGPEEFLIQPSGVRVFEDLEAGVRWASAILILRVQFERHDGTARISRQEYRRRWGLGPGQMAMLDPNAIFLHPGPINLGVEIEPEVLADSRSRVLKQVENGVHIRQSLIQTLLEGEL